MKKRSFKKKIENDVQQGKRRMGRSLAAKQKEGKVVEIGVLLILNAKIYLKSIFAM